MTGPAGNKGEQVVATPFEEALAGHSPDPLDVPDRSGDDHYLMYTGGTTGLPKGVLWRQEDAFFGCIGGGDPMRLQGEITSPAELPDRIVERFSFLPVAPLMHAAAQWTTLSWLFAGGKTTLMPGALDPAAVWQAVQDEGVNSITVVGDAVGRPLVAAWEAEPDRWDVSSLFSISNGGAPMSPSLKARLAELFPSKIIADGFGSSEAGVQGAQRLEAGRAGNGLARFTAGAGTEVFDDDLRPVEPGSGVIGRVANTGHLPIGYLNDPAKTAATFVEVDGRRYCFSGDMATIEADGTIQLMGRGSGCINTGGEKVFPEEVEAALVAHRGGDRCARGRRARRSLGPRRGRRGAGVTRRLTTDPRRSQSPPPPDPCQLQAAQASRLGRSGRSFAGRQSRLSLGQAHRGGRSDQPGELDAIGNGKRYPLRREGTVGPPSALIQAVCSLDTSGAQAYRLWCSGHGPGERGSGRERSVRVADGETALVSPSVQRAPIHAQGRR